LSPGAAGIDGHDFTPADAESLKSLKRSEKSKGKSDSAGGRAAVLSEKCRAGEALTISSINGRSLFATGEALRSRARRSPPRGADAIKVTLSITRSRRNLEYR
jgi:hypothetical protein